MQPLYVLKMRRKDEQSTRVFINVGTSKSVPLRERLEDELALAMGKVVTAPPCSTVSAADLNKHKHEHGYSSGHRVADDGDSASSPTPTSDQPTLPRAARSRQTSLDRLAQQLDLDSLVCMVSAPPVTSRDNITIYTVVFNPDVIHGKGKSGRHLEEKKVFIGRQRTLGKPACSSDCLVFQLCATNSFLCRGMCHVVSSQ